MAGPGRDRSLIIEAGGSGFVYDLSTGVEVLAVDGDWMMPEIGHWELLDGDKAASDHGWGCRGEPRSY